MILKGLPGAAVTLVCCALLAYVAWGAYRLRMAAWWCALAVLVFMFASYGVTFARTGVLEVYKQMGMTATQLQSMQELLPTLQPLIIVSCGISFVGVIVYLLWIRRHFTR